MAISKKIQDILSKSSWIRKMFEEGDNLKKQYGNERVFDFSLGNPCMEPPPRFNELLQNTAKEIIPGKHGYMPNAGYIHTREAISSYLRHKWGIPLSYNNIIMTCGAGGALNVILKTLLNPGDEVVIPAPFFMEYRFYVDNAGGLTKVVKTKDDFSLDIEAIGNAITEKTKVVLINSPNNPTGKVYDENSLDELSLLLREKSDRYKEDIFVISDEPYSDIVYDNIKVSSILSFYNNSIVASSYSKSLSIPGERIGYLAINPAASDGGSILDGAILCNRILGFVNAPAMMQRVIAGLQGTHVEVDGYRRKRKLLCEGLLSIGYRFNEPEGAFYLFVRSPIDDDVEFVNALLKERIIVVPGCGFEGPGFFRIAYCVPDQTITEAMDGFEKVFRMYSNI